MNWQPIETAPKGIDLWVGRWFEWDGKREWRMCQSGFYYDGGINTPDAYEPSYSYWSCDFDHQGVTEDEGPTHWMYLPEAPNGSK